MKEILQDLHTGALPLTAILDFVIFRLTERRLPRMIYLIFRKDASGHIQAIG